MSFLPWSRNGNLGGLAIFQDLLASQRQFCRIQRKETEKKIDSRRGGKTILRSGQGWALLAQL